MSVSDFECEIQAATSRLAGYFSQLHDVEAASNLANTVNVTFPEAQNAAQFKQGLAIVFTGAVTEDIVTSADNYAVNVTYPEGCTFDEIIINGPAIGELQNLNVAPLELPEAHAFGS